jgi:hypothetical protein
LLTDSLPQGLEATPQRLGTGVARPGPGADDQIDGRELTLMQAEGFADDAPDAVARHRATGRAYCDGQTEAWRS